MRAIKACLMVGVILAIGVVSRAQDKPMYVTSLTSTTMPSIEMKDKPLGKVLDELKAKVHDFNFVIHREAGVAADYPVLPAMTLQNVNVDQFLTLIGNEYPNIHITYIPDNSWKFPPLIEVDIKSIAATEPAATQPTIVRLFGLDELIDSRKALKSEEPSDKEVTNDIMSLIQAALEQSESKNFPVLKIHQPTRTLIFKGTAAQASIVSAALAVINPPQDKVNYEAENMHLKDANHAMAQQIKILTAAATRPAK